MEGVQHDWAPTSSWQEDGNGLLDEEASPDANEFNSLLQNLLGTKDSQQPSMAPSEMAMLPIPSGKSFADLLWEEEERKAKDTPSGSLRGTAASEGSHSSSPGRQSPGSVLSSGNEATAVGGKATVFVPVTPIWGERRSRVSESPESVNVPARLISSRLIAADSTILASQASEQASSGADLTPGLTSGVAAHQGFRAATPTRELWADSPSWGGAKSDKFHVRSSMTKFSGGIEQLPKWGNGTGKSIGSALPGFGRGQGAPAADFPPLGGARASQMQAPEKVVDSKEFPELPRAAPPTSVAPRKEEGLQPRGVMKLRKLSDLSSALSPHQNAWTCWNPVTGSKESQEDIESAQKEMAAHLRAALTKSISNPQDAHSNAWEDDERAAAKSEGPGRESEPLSSWEQQQGKGNLARWPGGRISEELDRGRFSSLSRPRAVGSSPPQGAYPPRPISRSDAAGSWRRKEPFPSQTSPSAKSEPLIEAPSQSTLPEGMGALTSQESGELVTSESTSKEAAFMNASKEEAFADVLKQSTVEHEGVPGSAGNSSKESQPSASKQDLAGQAEEAVAELLAAWEEAAENANEKSGATGGGASQERHAGRLLSERAEGLSPAVDESASREEVPATAVQASKTSEDTSEASLLPQSSVDEVPNKRSEDVTAQPQVKAEPLASLGTASHSDEQLKTETSFSALSPNPKTPSAFGGLVSPFGTARFGVNQDGLQPQVPRPFGPSASDGPASPVGGFADLDAAIIAAKQSRYKKPPDSWQGTSMVPAGAISPGGNLKALWVPVAGQTVGQTSVQEGSATNSEETTTSAETGSLSVSSPKEETKSEVSVTQASGEQAKMTSEPSLVNRREKLMQLITQRWRAPLGKQPLVRAESRSDSEPEGSGMRTASGSPEPECPELDGGRIEKAPFPGYTAEDLAGRQRKIELERREEESVNGHLQGDVEVAAHLFESVSVGEAGRVSAEEGLLTRASQKREGAGLASTRDTEGAAGVNWHTNEEEQTLGGELAIARSGAAEKRSVLTSEKGLPSSSERVDAEAASGEPVVSTSGKSRAATEEVPPGALASDAATSKEGSSIVLGYEQPSDAKESAVSSISTNAAEVQSKVALREEGERVDQSTATGWLDGASQAHNDLVLGGSTDLEPCETSQMDAKQGGPQISGVSESKEQLDGREESKAEQSSLEGESPAGLILPEMTVSALPSADALKKESVSQPEVCHDLRPALPIETTVLHGDLQNGRGIKSVMQEGRSHAVMGNGSDGCASVKAEADVWTFPEEAPVPARASESAAKQAVKGVNKAPLGVNGPAGAQASAGKAGKKTGSDSSDESFERLFVDVYQKLAFKLGRPFDISILLTELKKRTPGFDVKQTKHARFVDLCNAMAAKGHVRIFRASNMTFAALPDDPAQYGWGPNGLYQLPVGTNRPKSSNGRPTPAGGQSQGQSGPPKAKPSSVAKAPQLAKRSVEKSVPRMSSAPGLVGNRSGEQAAPLRATSLQASVQSSQVVKPAAAITTKGPEKKRSRAQVEAEALGALMLFLCETPSQQASDLGVKLIAHDRSLSEQVKVYFGGVKAFLAARPELFYVSGSHVHNPLISLYTGQDRPQGPKAGAPPKATAPPKPAVMQTPSTNPRIASGQAKQNGGSAVAAQSGGLQSSNGTSQGLGFGQSGRREFGHDTPSRSSSEASSSEQPRSSMPPHYGGSAQQWSTFGAASIPPNPKRAEWHVYLANLPLDCPANDVKAALSQFGEVHALSLPRERMFGFARFTSAQSAEAVLAQRFIEVGKRKVVLQRYKAQAMPGAGRSFSSQGLAM